MRWNWTNKASGALVPPPRRERTARPRRFPGRVTAAARGGGSRKINRGTASLRRGRHRRHHHHRHHRRGQQRRRALVREKEEAACAGAETSFDTQKRRARATTTAAAPLAFPRPRRGGLVTEIKSTRPAWLPLAVGLMIICPTRVVVAVAGNHSSSSSSSSNRAIMQCRRRRWGWRILRDHRARERLLREGAAGRARDRRAPKQSSRTEQPPCSPLHRTRTRVTTTRATTTTPAASCQRRPRTGSTATPTPQPPAWRRRRRRRRRRRHRRRRCDLPHSLRPSRCTPAHFPTGIHANDGNLIISRTIQFISLSV